jgi:hypothetical protein
MTAVPAWLAAMHAQGVLDPVFDQQVIIAKQFGGDQAMNTLLNRLQHAADRTTTQFDTGQPKKRPRTSSLAAVNHTLRGFNVLRCLHCACTCHRRLQTFVTPVTSDMFAACF